MEVVRKVATASGGCSVLFLVQGLSSTILEALYMSWDV